MHESNRRLQASRSFSHIPAAVDAEDGNNASSIDAVNVPDQNNINKLTRIMEKTRNISLLFPNKTIAGNTSFVNQQYQHLEQILHPMQHQHESWVQQQYKKVLKTPQPKPVENDLPPLPIENDPHIFDLLAKDTPSFIHYGKSDATITSATVEKLIEKITREMGTYYMY